MLKILWAASKGEKLLEDKGSLEAVLVIQREKLLAACVIVTVPACLAVLHLLKFCALHKTALNISPGLTIPKTRGIPGCCASDTSLKAGLEAKAEAC